MSATILHIDDSRLVLDLTRQALEAAGHRVASAISFDQIPVQLQALGEPELIILDVNMPEVAGEDLALFFRQQWQLPAPIILFSDVPPDELAATAERVQATRWINKSIGLNELLRTVEDCLPGRDNGDWAQWEDAGAAAPQPIFNPGPIAPDGEAVPVPRSVSDDFPTPEAAVSEAIQQEEPDPDADSSPAPRRSALTPYVKEPDDSVAGLRFESVRPPTRPDTLLDLTTDPKVLGAAQGISTVFEESQESDSPAEEGAFAHLPTSARLPTQELDLTDEDALASGKGTPPVEPSGDPANRHPRTPPTDQELLAAFAEPDDAMPPGTAGPAGAEFAEDAEPTPEAEVATSPASPGRLEAESTLPAIPEGDSEALPKPVTEYIEVDAGSQFEAWESNEFEDEYSPEPVHPVDAEPAAAPAPGSPESETPAVSAPPREDPRSALRVAAPAPASSALELRVPPFRREQAKTPRSGDKTAESPPASPEPEPEEAPVELSSAPPAVTPGTPPIPFTGPKRPTRAQLAVPVKPDLPETPAPRQETVASAGEPAPVIPVETPEATPASTSSPPPIPASTPTPSPSPARRATRGAAPIPRRLARFRATVEGNLTRIRRHVAALSELATSDDREWAETEWGRHLARLAFEWRNLGREARLNGVPLVADLSGLLVEYLEADAARGVDLMPLDAAADAVDTIMHAPNPADADRALLDDFTRALGR